MYAQYMPGSEHALVEVRTEEMLEEATLVLVAGSVTLGAAVRCVERQPEGPVSNGTVAPAAASLRVVIPSELADKAACSECSEPCDLGPPSFNSGRKVESRGSMDSRFLRACRRIRNT